MAGEFMAGEFDQQRIARLKPLAEVLARIDVLVKPVAPRRAGAYTALGRVLADDVVAGAPVPAVARALRDGFAVAADAISDASSYAPVQLVPPHRVDLGDTLPAGADAVAPLDAVVGRNGRYEAIAPVAPGDGVLGAGADMVAGTVPRRAGNRLRASDVAALAAAGIGAVSIREPRVLLAIARPGDAVAGGIRGLLTAAVAASGASCRAIGVGDLAAVLGNAEADAVLVIGGTGAGGHDTSVRALAGAGRVEVHGGGPS